MKKILQKPYILFVIIGLGVLVAMLLVKGRQPSKHTDAEMPSRNVEVIKAQRIPFGAKVVAYGNVEPAITLKTLAESLRKPRWLLNGVHLHHGE